MFQAMKNDENAVVASVPLVCHASGFLPEKESGRQFFSQLQIWNKGS